jgi:hypothetical protein
MDVSNNRLFRFSKPEWLNNSAVRNGGVYVSGALVSLNARSDPSPLHLHTPDMTFKLLFSPRKWSLC